MKILVLSRNASLYSTARLVEAAKQRGHEAHVVNALNCYMNVTAEDPCVYYKKSKLIPDAVIPRVGASITSYATAVLRQWEVADVYTLNPSIAISRSRDKFRAHQLLAKKGVHMPVTGYAHSADTTDHLISLVGGAPLIVKLMESTHGKGVVLAETTKAAEGVIEAFRGLHANFLVQQFIKESLGVDIRCFVIGDKVVAAMQRTPKEGDFRSNLHRGGKGVAIKLTKEERAIAVKAAKVMGLHMAGVDILRSKKGPLVIEVNSSPGLQGIERVTGVDVAAKIIAYIEKDILKKTKEFGG